MRGVILRAGDWGAAAGAARPMAATVPRAGVLAALIAAIAVAVFSPTLGHDFVNWDDHANFVHNAGYRGLGAEQLRWMVQSVHMGHWIPLTWLTLGLDYVLWGLDPAGYHLTNVLLHGLNAAVFFLLALRLLRLAVTGTPAGAIRLGAAAAALAFALHPLRVESVAWVTERRDVVSGLFALLTVLAYLRAREPGEARPAVWRCLSLVAFYLAVMSKSIVVSVPVVLVLLDFYPLRRVAWGQWREMRLAVSDKLPYVPIAGIGAGIAVLAGRLNAIFASLDHLPALDRLGFAAYSAWFYLSRSVVPVGLSPLHGVPASTTLWQPRFLGSMLAMLLLGAVALRCARRRPGVLVALLAYLVILAPVSGALQNGHQLVAERYSYLSCLSWALVLGGVVAAAARAGWPRAVPQRVVVLLVTVWMTALPFATAAQTAVWRDSEALWRSAVDTDPSCATCHSFYGIHLRTAGAPDRALPHLVEAFTLKPTRRSAEDYLGQMTLTRHALGDAEGALETLEILRRASPSFAGTVEMMLLTAW